MDCFLCKNADSNVVCKSCDKYFCTQRHLDLHTSKDGSCLPYDVVESEDFGRYLVASKDIDAGELILSEDCLVWGPNHVGDYLCLECLQLTDSQKFCEHCGYPLCDEHIVHHPAHEDECKLFQEKLFKLPTSIRENDIESVYPLIAPLRCLRLKSLSPESWRMISRLMDHRTEREEESELYIEPYRHDVINKIVHDLQAGDEREVVQVLGYLDVNSIAVRGKDGVYRGRGIYPVASLMNHACICNTRNIIQETRLETYATVPIKRGDLITTHYVSPLLPVNIRREKLKERWFFDCSCERCKSRTDSTAYTSGLKCKRCEEDLLLPVDPLDYSTEYRCDSCGHSESSDFVTHLVSSLSPLVQALQVFQMPGTTEEENLVKQLEQSLHKHHHLLLELKVNLARKLGRSTGTLADTENETLIRKVELCSETLGVMNIIYPGCSKYRGLLAFELAETMLTLSARIVEGTFDGRADLEVALNTIEKQPDTDAGEDLLVKHIKACEAFVNEGLRCLVFDRPGSYEHEVCKQLHFMKSSCTDLLHFRQFL